MKAVRLSLCLVLGLCFLVSCVESPTVVQGKVQSYSADSKTLMVQDERPPGPELTISLQGAEIGADPAPGDQVRVSYRDQAGKLVAIRVMNLTKQKDSGKSGGH
jgi:hypothetical protein